MITKLEKKTCVLKLPTFREVGSNLKNFGKEHLFNLKNILFDFFWLKID
jgi:hypothetical protein